MGVININIHSRDTEDLTLALKLLCRQWKKTEGYRIDVARNELHLYWAITKGNPEAAVPFPTPMENGELLATIIEAWLRDATYPPEPNHDGSNGKGWHFTAGEWVACGSNYVSAIIKPYWVEYHK